MSEAGAANASQKDIAALAILTDGNEKYRPDRYETSFFGTTLTYVFNVSKVIDYNDEDLANNFNPFATLMLAAKRALKVERSDDETKKLFKIALLRLGTLGIAAGRQGQGGGEHDRTGLHGHPKRTSFKPRHTAPGFGPRSQAAIAPLYVWWQGFDWPSAILQSMIYVGFCAFSFITGLVARQQTEAREEQRRLNAELRSTRALLAESARVNERTRISRELHDLLGHHLTALSLNLEVAGHLSEGRVREHVLQAHALARLLLTDVREAVSQLREGGVIDLGAVLRPLAENVPKLAIDMDIEEPLTVDDPERAHVLLRCTQEAITNAVRHAGARHLWLVARREGERVILRVRDDGHGSDAVVPGNGLRGLEERLQQYGGTLAVDSQRGEGFQLTMALPVAANAGIRLHGESDA